MLFLLLLTGRLRLLVPLEQELLLPLVMLQELLVLLLVMELCATEERGQERGRQGAKERGEEIKGGGWTAPVLRQTQETDSYGKRDLFIWQKKPTNTL